jgi:hypothetical protein
VSLDAAADVLQDLREVRTAGDHRQRVPFRIEERSRSNERFALVPLNGQARYGILIARRPDGQRGCAGCLRAPG